MCVAFEDGQNLSISYHEIFLFYLFACHFCPLITLRITLTKASPMTYNLDTSLDTEIHEDSMGKLHFEEI